MPYLFATFISIFLSISQSVFACGASSNCNLAEDRHYRIHMPAGHDGKTKIGAIVFAHGLGGSATRTIQNQNLIRTVNGLGVALIALKAKNNDWNIKNSPKGRSDRNSNEFNYLDNVIEDITRNFPIDKNKLMLAGVSVGGTFTWTMACTGQNRFAAFMPISGTYWLNPPKSCDAISGNIIHVHGTADLTVPLTGRRVGSSAHSNVEDVIKSYARIKKFKKTGKFITPALRCEARRDTSGNVLDFCLHDGGHNYRVEDIEYAWRKFQSLGVL